MEWVSRVESACRVLDVYSPIVLSSTDITLWSSAFPTSASTNVSVAITMNPTVVLALCQLFCLSATGRSDDRGDRRLPGDTEPVSYELWLKPAVDAAGGDHTFSGRVDIVVRTKRYTRRVVLNAAADLVVSSVSDLQDVRADRSVAVSGFAREEREERLVIGLRERLIPSRIYKFAVSFRGTLRDDFTGFHKYFYDYNDKSR